MDNGMKSQSESGKEVEKVQAAGSATPQPIKPNGFATAYLLVVDLLMIVFSAGVALGVICLDGFDEIGVILLAVYSGPILIVLWVIGLFFCKYTQIGKNFYKFSGVVVALITAIIMLIIPL